MVRKLAFYPPDVPATLAPVQGSLVDLFLHTAAVQNEAAFLHFLGRKFSYSEVENKVKNVAAILQKNGLKKDDHVALYLPNCPQYVVAFYAVLMAGGSVVNGSPLQTEAEMHAQLKNCGAKMVVTVRLQPFLGAVQEAIKNTAVQQLWLADLAAAMPPLTALGFKVLKLKKRPLFAPKQVQNLDAAMLIQGTPKPVKIKPTDTALLQYTGGTTGIPKGAVLSHGALRANIQQLKMWLGKAHEGAVFLAVLPLFHIFANTTILGLAVATRGQIVLLPQFKLTDVVAAINTHKVSILHGVPALFNALAGVAKPDKLQSLRFGICGGAPLPPEVKLAFEKATPATLVEGYGLTEASPVLACNTRMYKGHVPPAGAVGLPLPSTVFQVRSLDNPSKVLPVGQTGELVAKGPQLMHGYWHNKNATSEVLKNGWLHTGDIGHIDANGYVFVTSRLKEMLIVNGYNVYPRVVEEALLRLPNVAEAAVVGVKDARKGEAPYAFITLKTVTTLPHAVLEKELLEQLKKSLHKHAVPLKIEVLPSLPKSPVGKVLKKDLKPSLA